jgi:glutamate carboxypeptidase
MSKQGEHPVLAWLQTQEPAMVELLHRLVEAESPSSDPGSHGRVVGLLEEALRSAGLATRRVGTHATGCHLFARPPTRVHGAPYQLAVGHFDTVWPVGTVASRPPRLEDGRLYGPGSFDAKGGLVQYVFALRALRATGAFPAVTPVLLANSDEEIGSIDSSRFIRQLARRADRAFVLEPSDGSLGRLKTSRKGVARFRLAVQGRASHAGGSPERGVSAILELSHQIQRLFALNDRERGVTVNVGTIEGGLRPNVVAPAATALVDVRVPTAKEGRRVEREILALQPVQDGVTLSVTGGLLLPPMPQTARNHALCRRAQVLGGQLGLRLGDAPLVGGASDANLTSCFTATLDGLGALGDGAHAEDEHVVVSALPERAALLALLLLEPPCARRDRRQRLAPSGALARLAG